MRRLLSRSLADRLPGELLSRVSYAFDLAFKPDESTAVRALPGFAFV
jgi:hypothetical protein